MFQDFDPRILSEKELFEKQLDLTKRQILAFKLGNHDVSEHLRYMIQLIENERRERMFNDYVGKYLVSGTVIETDPVLKAEDLKKKEEIEEKTKDDPKKDRPIYRPNRTSKPAKIKE